MKHELSRRQEVAQRDLEHARRAASTETDAVGGELKRLSAHHRETKEMLADRQSKVAQLTELKTQIEVQVTGTEQELSKTQEELGARSGDLDATSNQYKQALMQAHGEIEMLRSALEGTEHELSLLRTKTQNDITTRSQEFADSQVEVAQLTRLKTQIEGQNADLDGKLTGTEQGLCKAQVDLAMRSQELEERCCSFEICMEQQQAASEEMQAHCNAAITQISETQGDLASRSQELADSQSDVEQLTERKAQLDGQIAVLDGKLASTEQALCKTEDDLATRSQELVGSQSEVA